LSSTALSQALSISRANAQALRQGRLPIGAQDAQWLYQYLAVEPGDITRALRVDETLDWNFYRISARHPVDVWRRAHRQWQPHMSNRRAAEVLGLDPSHVAAVVAGKTQRPVLSRPPAAQLAHILSLEDGPEAFIRGLNRHHSNR
jgi:hypothetical protein